MLFVINNTPSPLVLCYNAACMLFHLSHCHCSVQYAIVYVMHVSSWALQPFGLVKIILSIIKCFNRV